MKQQQNEVNWQKKKHNTADNEIKHHKINNEVKQNKSS